MTRILKLALPSIVALFFQYLAEMINSFFIGHLDDSTLLAGTGMGNIVINMLCISVFLGLNGAIETLVSQAYGTSNMNMCTI
jgi:Na+-driven multidrug efflux pump